MGGKAEQLVLRGNQRFITMVGPIFETQCKPGGRTQPVNRRWHDGDHHPFADSRGGFLRFGQFAGGGDAVTLVPVVQNRENQCRVRTSAGETEPDHGLRMFDAGAGGVVFFNQLHRLRRAGHRRISGKLKRGDKEALILVREE